jgi:hypothetical protein
VTFFILAALGRASPGPRVALLFAVKLAVAGVAGAVGVVGAAAATCAGFAAAGPGLLFSVQPARAWEKVRNKGKRNTAFRREGETRVCFTEYSLEKIGMSLKRY